MTVDEAIAEIRTVVPENWEVYVNQDSLGFLNQFSVLTVKGVHGGELYGYVEQWTGNRPTDYEWQWKLIPDDWGDFDTWPDNPPPPPDRPGLEGETIRMETLVPFTYAWQRVPVAWEPFDAIAEAKPGYFRGWAQQQFGPILERS